MMRLIAINKEVLINADQIQYIEQRQVKGRTFIVVCVGKEEFELDMAIEKFMGILERSGVGGQIFAG